jgi:ABC-2 type transport system ATP-binding protein
VTMLLDVSGLRRCFGTQTAVDDVSFSVSEGEVFGLLGPNGAGKSTTVAIICGLQTPDAGTVLLNGQSVDDNPLNTRRLLGVVPQDLAIYSDLSAEENLRFFGALHDLSGTQLESAVAESLQVVDLWDRRHDAAATYSGGMKRRLNFAAAILHQPRLLILDEPTVGVDPQSRHHLLRCVRTLQDRGTGVVYVSHYMEEVEAVCSRVAIIDHGRVLRCDTLETLLSQVPQEIELVLPSDAAEVLRDRADLSVTPANDELRVRLREAGGGAEDLTSRLAALMQDLAAAQCLILSIRTHEPGLERLFLDLTGTQLRD